MNFEFLGFAPVLAITVLAFLLGFAWKTADKLPDKAATRAEVAAMILRAMKLIKEGKV